MRHHRRATVAVLFLAVTALALAAACGKEKLEPGNPRRGESFALQKCRFCHYIDGNGGMIAPPMEKSIALAGQVVREYDKRVEELKTRFAKAYAAEQVSIDGILAEKDLVKRYERWLGAYLKDTKFDNPMTKMGNVLMTDQQRADVVAWLMTRKPAL
ncbi:MAG TPA: c-type cytochrome [Planctomycetota bacterium]|nr:c-type cytochrome [Planctomycetota bacterium]